MVHTEAPRRSAFGPGVLALAFFACAPPPPPTAGGEVPPTAAMAPTDTLTAHTSAVLRRWIDDVWHRGRLDLVDSLVATTYTRHEDDSTYTVTREQYADQIRALRSRFPELRYDVHDSAAIGDRFWIRYTFRGGPDSTGPWPTRPGLQVYRLEDGRLAETWMLLRPGGTEWDDGPVPPTSPGRTPAPIDDPQGDVSLKLVDRGDFVTALQSTGMVVKTWDGVLTRCPVPFAHSSLPLVGFSIIEAESIEQVVDLVAHTPCARGKGASEIRPLLP